MMHSIHRSSFGRMSALFILLTLAAGIGVCWGQTIIRVNTFDDSAAVDGWKSDTTVLGTISLRSAIQYANHHAVDSIVLQTGVYRLTRSGALVYGAGVADEDTSQYGDLDINNSMVIKGNGPSNTIVNGYDERVFEINPLLKSSVTVLFAQFKIRGGIAMSTTTTQQTGGGIEIHDAAVTLDTVSVDSNKVFDNGGGINITADGVTTLTFNGGTIDSNFAGANGSLGTGGGGACLVEARWPLIRF